MSSTYLHFTRSDAAQLVTEALLNTDQEETHDWVGLLVPHDVSGLEAKGFARGLSFCLTRLGYDKRSMSEDEVDELRTMLQVLAAATCDRWLSQTPIELR